MPDKTFNQELMDVFYEEAQTLIDKIRNDLIAFSEKRIPAILHRLFRYAHTIKSSSGIVGFDDLREVAQALEKIFIEAENAQIDINAEVISLISESVEVCQKLLNKEKAVAYKALLSQMDSILHL